MITRDDIRAMLAGCEAMGLPAELDDHTPLLVDSFALLWLKHMFDETYGLVIDPDPAETMAFTSVEAIHAYLRRSFPDRVGER